MNSFLYDDGSDADCQQSCQLHTKRLNTKKSNVIEEFWNEMFDIEQLLKRMGLHK